VPLAPVPLTDINVIIGDDKVKGLWAQCLAGVADPPLQQTGKDPGNDAQKVQAALQVIPNGFREGDRMQ